MPSDCSQSAETSGTVVCGRWPQHHLVELTQLGIGRLCCANARVLQGITTEVSLPSNEPSECSTEHS